MSFQVIPALDVSGGRLVRMSPTGPVAVEAFAGDPLQAARAFVDAGVARLHVVDVDLALRGDVGNAAVVTDVAALGAQVQASGNVTSGSQVDRLLNAGADRVVLASAALRYRDASERLLALMPDQLVVGIEADGPTIRPRGRGLELPLWDTLVWLGQLDVRRYLFTEVGRSGTLSGPDLDGVWALATHTGGPVIASGGVRDAGDIRAVRALGDAVEGVVIGRALYEDLAVADAWAAGG